MDARLTYRQRQIYEWMVFYLLEHQRQPTIREIAKRFGIASPNGVARHLKAMVRKGHLAWERHGQRKFWILTRVKLTAEPRDPTSDGIHWPPEADGILVKRLRKTCRLALALWEKGELAQDFHPEIQGRLRKVLRQKKTAEEGDFFRAIEVPWKQPWER